jgi:DNA-binding NarL/FixJ family response regulator
MAKTTSAETGCSSVPTGQKRTHLAPVNGRQATPTDPRCDLCVLLGHSPSQSTLDHQLSTRLRIALVDGDQGTRLAALEMVQAQRDGWTMQVYHPPCQVRGRSCLKRASCPNALDVDGHPGNPPDIILISLSILDGSGFACVRKLKALAPDLPVLIICGRFDEASIAEYCIAGADGYLLNPVAPEELANAVTSVAQGWPVLCPEAQKAIMNVLHRAATATTVWFPGLTGREQEIAGCLMAHLCDNDISTRLDIKEATVHVHLTRLYRKLQVHSRRQAVAKLLGAGGAKSNPF